MRFLLFLILLSGCASAGVGTRAFDTATLWYPADVKPIDRIETAFVAHSVSDAPLPPGVHGLVLLSHGNGGNPASLAWLAEMLARHGYLVAAPLHEGTNFRDVTPTRTFAFWKRVPELSRLLNALLADPELGPRIDRSRISMIGFSLGGSTVLAAAGMEYDPRAFEKLCVARDCDLLRDVKRSEIHYEPTRRDERISSYVSIAPAFAAGFRPRPVSNLLIIASDSDEVVPFATNAGAIAQVGQEKLLLVRDAGHYSFLTHCGPKISMPLCKDLGKARERVHADLEGPILEIVSGHSPD